jgi:hypothetical protein
MTSQGTAAGSFRRAVNARHDAAMMAALEIPRLSLDLSLELVELLAEANDSRFDKAASRWLARFASEGADLHQLQLAGAALNQLEVDPGSEVAREALGARIPELAPEPVPEPVAEPVPAGVGEPAPAVVAATVERPAFTVRPLPASAANPCEEAGIRVTIGCGGCAGSAP